MLLTGKTAIISGAAGARGIGFATAKTFADQGARVAILDLDGAGAVKAAAELGQGHLGLACNVTDKADCERAVSEVLKAFGKIDILINNAGITQPVKVWDIVPQDWDRIQDVNLRGVLYLSQAVMPHMRAQKAGSIACMSSVSAQRGGGILGGAHYSAAKAGVLGLAKAMARELGPDNIRVNCVAPGLIATDINIGKIAPEKEQEILAGIPLGRLGKPQDVAKIFLFLASDLSAYTTGAVIDVNGGMHIH
jgi:NAD(P)-dependent dehydrogenase (short-subunit alcohol dehydrogenase family)